MSVPGKVYLSNNKMFINQHMIRLNNNTSTGYFIQSRVQYKLDNQQVKVITLENTVFVKKLAQKVN